MEKCWKSIHCGPIALIVFNTTDSLVATGGTDSTIKVWDVRHHYCTHNLKGAKGVLSVITFAEYDANANKYLIFGAADDYCIHVWNLITSERVATIVGHSSKITAIELSADRRCIISGSRDTIVFVWDAITFEKIRNIAVSEVRY